ncbi:MAG: MBL fold metallo-hydrolase [Leptospiraceae bacterium]|jgi:flavorubredoxin|nr:MBL fold metallo-hydrolase [Leptospiraceae bacterium]MCZ8345700.1 MBL fold metallo-hydrolase [Leptospiraceae bacterium]
MVQKNNPNSTQELQIDIDTNYAVEIADGVYWVGFYSEEDALHCNPYLIKSNESGILIDPGSVPDFPIVARKVFSIIQAQAIDTIILQHQDPDLCAGVPIFEDLRNDYEHVIISEIRASYLIKHYGVKGHLHMVSPENSTYTTPNGRKLEFLMTPFAHFAGAIMTYDMKSKVLFTSDILGGLGADWELYHTDQALANMKKFLSLYMPSNLALRYALLKIRSVDAEIIAPQHGQIIKRQQLDTIIQSLWDLKCGLDLIDDDFMRKALQK